ncbi:37939_t:CDS:2 [Gigaspora margarita]|uniref:37939_t:CDS:1 n=1 Tax=Gigaspora margarita TaxID=4874 RepID=A0ABN7VYL0_GIGMA|nr:37939_t:CDS:2 [Gigaspora margarita]
MLAHLHSEEIEKLKKKKLPNKKNTQSKLISSTKTVYVEKVIVLYFENYNNHCYMDELVTNLNDISYISLHVYLSIHFNLFSDILKEGCNLLTHHLASNILYHVDKLGVSIDGNVLKLLENEKNIMITLVMKILFKK